ncbi:MAG TPA: carboxylesterase/lipase family protein [Vicinamibacterales bacterium]|nr:carboxylesterase/lipase family protein [Vicinamibacterales bacterium]
MIATPSRRDFLKQSGFLIAATSTGLSYAFAQDGAPVIAETAYGRIRGSDVAGIKVFKGVPYGASTAGKNRFMPPVAPAKWTGVRDAIAYGPSAPQSEPGTRRTASPRAVAAAGLPAESEDCLVLNVWTPAIADGRKRPVMFWCHGGGFATGSGSSPVTEGANLARRGDVVVVTINHRLNVLGFTSLEEPGGSEFETSGDVGMLDIVRALEWVRDNIAQFGGDPNTVMIFGQSGGGRKVSTLLAMPSAKGLFHRAIIESGATLKLVEPPQGARVARELMSTLGLSKTQVRELQLLPVDTIMSAYFAVVRRMNVDQMTQGFSPLVDGTVVPRHPFHPTASAVSADVPVMLGSTRTELTSSAQDEDFSLSDAAMRGRIRQLLGDQADGTIRVYQKANPGATSSDLYFLIASDYRYSGPVMKIAERRAALGKGPVYLYYFRWETPVDGGRLKSPHTIEIPFAFDNVKAAARLTGGGPEAMALADRVSDTWIAFARTGNPNTPKLPRWPAFTAADRPTMVFNNGSRVENDPIKEQRLAMFRALGLS